MSLTKFDNISVIKTEYEILYIVASHKRSIRKFAYVHLGDVKNVDLVLCQDLLGAKTPKSQNDFSGIIVLGGWLHNHLYKGDVRRSNSFQHYNSQITPRRMKGQPRRFEVLLCNAVPRNDLIHVVESCRYEFHDPDSYIVSKVSFPNLGDPKWSTRSYIDSLNSDSDPHFPRQQEVRDASLMLMKSTKREDDDLNDNLDEIVKDQANLWPISLTTLQVVWLSETCKSIKVNNEFLEVYYGRNGGTFYVSHRGKKTWTNNPIFLVERCRLKGL